MNFGSLFTGAGGMDLGLERAGMVCKWQVEIDDYCRQVLEKHWPGKTRYEDVRDCGAHNLERVDLVCGGFPCTDLSVAGKRAGLSGEHSGLFYELARIASELRPTWLVLENVPGLLSSENGRDMGAIIGRLEDAGYSVAWRVLDSQWFGVAQRRRRVFFVCHSDARCAGAVLFEPEGGAGHSAKVRKAGADIAHSLDARTGGVSGKENQETLVGYTIHGSLARRGASRTDRAGCLRARAPGASENSSTTVIFDWQSGGKCKRGTPIVPMPQNATVQQQRSDDGSCDVSHVAHSLQRKWRNEVDLDTIVGTPAYPNRMREVAGLPRGLDGRRYKALGNAVTVPVLEWLGRRIMAVDAAAV